MHGVGSPGTLRACAPWLDWYQCLLIEEGIRKEENHSTFPTAPSSAQAETLPRAAGSLQCITLVIVHLSFYLTSTLGHGGGWVGGWFWLQRAES